MQEPCHKQHTSEDSIFSPYLMDSKLCNLTVRNVLEIQVKLSVAIRTSGEASPIFSHEIVNFEWLPLFICLEIHCFYGRNNVEIFA